MSFTLIGFILYLVVILIVGFVMYIRNKSHQDFIIGGRKIKPVVLSFKQDSWENQYIFKPFAEISKDELQPMESTYTTLTLYRSFS